MAFERERELLTALRRVKALGVVSPDTKEAVLLLLESMRATIRADVFNGGASGVEKRAVYGHAADRALMDAIATISDPSGMIEFYAGLVEGEDSPKMAKVNKMYRAWTGDVAKWTGALKAKKDAKVAS